MMSRMVAPARLPRTLGELLRRAAVDHDYGSPLPDAAALLGDLDPDLLPAAARAHRVSGAVQLALGEGNVPLEGWGAELRADYAQGLGTHLRGLASLELASSALAAADLPWLVFKGPVLAAACYPRPDLRRYEDVDLLVRSRDMGTAVAALEAAGCQVLDRNWDLIDEAELGELHLLSPTGMVLDLHWDLIHRRDRRSRFSIDVREMLGRASSLDLGPVRAPTLDPVDSVLHLAVHSALAGASRLGWLMDVDQSLRRRGPDWTELVSRAHAWQAAVVVHLVLERCRSTLGSPVPAEVLRELQSGRVWRGLVHGVQALDPAARSTGRRSPAEALARASSRTPGSTLRTLVANRRRNRAIHHAPEADSGRDPSRPGSVMFESGGAERRAAYFERLAEADRRP